MVEEAEVDQEKWYWMILDNGMKEYRQLIKYSRDWRKIDDWHLTGHIMILSNA